MPPQHKPDRLVPIAEGAPPTAGHGGTGRASFPNQAQAPWDNADHLDSGTTKSRGSDAPPWDSPTATTVASRDEHLDSGTTKSCNPGLPAPHGGVRPGAGRPALAHPRVKRSVTLSPTTDAWVRAQQRPTESYSTTLERLLQAVQPWHLIADTLPDAVVLLVSRLTPERQRVPMLYRRLGWSRGQLERVVQAHRGMLVNLGVWLHVATKDVASGRKEGGI